MQLKAKVFIFIYIFYNGLVFISLNCFIANRRGLAFILIVIIIPLFLVIMINLIIPLALIIIVTMIIFSSSIIVALIILDALQYGYIYIRMVLLLAFIYISIVYLGTLLILYNSSYS